MSTTAFLNHRVHAVGPPLAHRGSAACGPRASLRPHDPRHLRHIAHTRTSIPSLPAPQHPLHTLCMYLVSCHVHRRT